MSNIYPPIRQLIPKTNLPIDLTSISDFINGIFDNLAYKDLIVEKSESGDAAFYKLTIVTLDRIGYEIPGTGGISIVLNPSFVPGGSNTSEFGISLKYQLEILKYIKGFSSTNFKSDPKAYFDLLLEILNLSISEILEEAIEVLIGGTSSTQDFINNFNEVRGNITNLEQNSGLDPNNFVDMALQINNIGYDVISVLLEDYLNIGSVDDFFDNIKKLFNKWFGDIKFSEIFKRLFMPEFNVELDVLTVGMEFPENYFNPVTPDFPGQKTILTFNVGSLSYESEGAFVFKNISTIDFPTSYILNSNFFIGITGLKLDFSRTKNIPEADADGRPVDFIGAYITEGIIGFPQFWNHDDSNSTGQLIARNLLVGTGGISGTIGLEAKTNGNPSPLISASFGEGFKVSLDAFDLTFQQNSIIESNIHGSMKIPGFKDASGDDAEINIDIWIGTDGEFSVTASEDDGIALRIPDVLNVIVKSLTVGRKEDRFYVAVSGAIEFADLPAPIGQFLPDSIEVQKLLIWEDGQIEYEGGTLVLPNAISLKIGPVELSITAIGLGSHKQMHDGIERKYKFFEFSGGININPGGVDARGDGIKFYFTVDDDEVGQSKHFFVRIQGIAIDIMIPGSSKPEDAALLLSGYLAMKDPQPGNEAAGTEYAGGIEFSLPKLKMGGSASMRLNPKVPAFIVDIGLEISTPIPLGATGLGIYGFRALIGQRYVATKSAASVPDDGPWWQYYKAKISPDRFVAIQFKSKPLKTHVLRGFSFNTHHKIFKEYNQVGPLFGTIHITFGKVYRLELKLFVYRRLKKLF